ncbi:hypothetical protein LSAT2_019636 [Lamellibrachia satsuma]|nr:hypothetical protein LSAT2_019636 [Lamellibrachia satsuma]
MTDSLGTIMEKYENVKFASSEESLRKRDDHSEDTKDPTMTLDKTSVEAVAASSDARYHVERPKEEDYIKVLEDVCNNTSHDSNRVALFSKYSAWQTMLLLESFENQKLLSKLQLSLEVELEELRLLVVAIVGREQGGCASSSGGGTVDDKVGKDTRDARESSPQPGRKLRGGKVTGRRETGRKETGRKGTGGKTTGAKERGVGETGGKDKGVWETGGKEKGVGETGGKTTGVKEREVGETRAKEWEVGETGAKETGGKGSGQNGMEGIERKSYSAALIEGVRKRARVFVGDSIVRKTDRVLNKGDDVVVCLPGAKIEAITERVKNIVGSGIRDFHGLNHDRFEADLLEHLASVDTSMDVGAMVDQYEHAVISTVDVHAPVTSRMKTCRRKEPWSNDDVRSANALRCLNEKSQPVSYQLNRLLHTTDEELRNIIKLCPSKTCSQDDCPIKLLKRTLHIHIPYVVAIINNSFEQGIFPNMLRTAVVKPLPKSDTINKDLLNNYRPVSNIVFNGKVLEKVAVHRLTEHLTMNGLHEEYQSAYKTLHSTETAQLTVKNRRTFNTDEASIPMMMRRVCQEEFLRDSFIEILGIVKLTDTLLLLMTAVAGNVGFNLNHKQAVLLDFGTARKFADGDACTMQGMTLFYMAPELYKGKLNKKADVYATTCLVYFLVYDKHMWPDEMMGTENIFEFFKELTPQHINQKIPKNLHYVLRDLLIHMCHPDTRFRLSATEALEHEFITQFCIIDSSTVHTQTHLPDIQTAPELTTDNRWAEAEPPCLLELLSGDEGEGADEGDQDRADDRRTSNTDELAVAGQIPDLSQLLPDVVMKSVEGNQEEQAVAGKDPQMHPLCQASSSIHWHCTRPAPASTGTAPGQLQHPLHQAGSSIHWHCTRPAPGSTAPGWLQHPLQQVVSSIHCDRPAPASTAPGPPQHPRRQARPTIHFARPAPASTAPGPPQHPRRQARPTIHCARPAPASTAPSPLQDQPRQAGSSIHCARPAPASTAPGPLQDQPRQAGSSIHCARPAPASTAPGLLCQAQWMLGKHWQKVTVQRPVNVRSYEVETYYGSVFRRNRRHLRQTTAPPAVPEIKTQIGLPPEADDATSATPVRRSVTQPYQTPPPATAAPPIVERRSGRHVRRPVDLKDFV